MAAVCRPSDGGRHHRADVTRRGRRRRSKHEHPHILTSRHNLAGACLSAGRVQEAIALHEQVLTDCERILSVGHSLTTTVRVNLEHIRQKANVAR